MIYLFNLEKDTLGKYVNSNIHKKNIEMKIWGRGVGILVTIQPVLSFSTAFKLICALEVRQGNIQRPTYEMHLLVL